MSPPNSTRKPKILIFDIGGVCVLSPMQAILDYETANSIPKGYINFAISASKPNGAWHRLEKGQILLDEGFFGEFKGDLERQSTWESFWARRKDHAGSSTSTASSSSTSTSTTPPSQCPPINASELYWTMMSHSRTPDPNIYPALKSLHQSRKYHLVGLSNTSIFPPNHPFNTPHPDDPRTLFDLFVSSAHVGMRKPEREIYEYTMKLIQEKWKDEEIKAGDVVFLDDIGENLKMGREVGWRTIKVVLGRSGEAVRELEGVLGERLVERSGRDGGDGGMEKAKL